MRGWLLVSVLLPAVVVAQTLSGGVDEVKAAYLSKFVDYVDWPDAAFVGAAAPIVIGVVGADPVYAELVQVVAGRSSHGRPLAARRLAPGDAFDGVHLIYVGEAGILRSAWLQPARERPMLIVTDGPQGLDAGAALNFVTVQNKMRFEASLRAVERAGLKVSSRLLALAQRVVGAP
jgi:hypothetical protein